MIPILYPGNLLAPPSIVTATGTAAGFPLRRLYDGEIGLPWKDSASGTRQIILDQGATGARAIDTVIFAAGHNLAGLTVSLDSAPDGSAWTQRALFTVTAGVHRQSVPIRLERWWRLNIVAPSVAPAIAEVVFTAALALPVAPVLRGQDVGQLSNVVDLESYGGMEWGLARGAVRWTSLYPLVAMDQTSRDALVTAHRTLAGGAQHCYLTDVDGVTRWVNWSDRQLRFASPLQHRYDVVLSFREVLGAA